jgi:chemotaxis receptor (MCP) glutamine deamidase CheD
MMTYSIQSNAGVILGTYAGSCASDALDTLARAAGYLHYIEMCRVAGDGDWTTSPARFARGDIALLLTEV